ncbi:MAG TPA: EscI/YscI/HrpB family type III secretion system inner rod protein [Polyangiaceae bacterium LLY-WYZ-15_(1-7)]|nr:EscI/YscI/HrpB family type III secretion system inner rod protein [Polyangiaceae bacterium LLY-WYZ-15_(1-7)]HJL12442.1 EscI/YscI/HrpB family type III secretion system inner rod protein [Polyangiaceae bacterium LLY-WYZ-15_(1-7)]HJL22492.1 EscI/YscI/HrpB family type III secretion system inner rod protein [Polyangiaceae bacterium LLY-WYZ-15_(1-7)]HJL35211.1 EscI/YscI/HrpB family type III secretion system inner rod protein [Polyangiaceae bacterium LLY-WYZ-15_(1-7)]
MPDPISSAALQILPEGASASSREAPGRSFGEVLEDSAAPAAPEAPFLRRLGDAARRLAEDDRAVQRAMGAARRGRELDPAELLALQAGVYRYAQEMELASKVVDKSTTALKTVLQSQQ